MSDAATIKKLADEMASNHEKVKQWMKVWTGIGAIALLLLIPVTMFWHAYVLATLWAWFGESVFHTHISTFAAGGLTIFARLLFWPNMELSKGEKKGVMTHVAINLGVPLVALGVGALWFWLGWGH